MAVAGVKDRTEYNRRWRLENPDKVKAQQGRHREKRIEQTKKWRERIMADPVRRKEQSRKTSEYHRRKRENDPDYAAKSKARAKRYYRKIKSDPVKVSGLREYSLNQYYQRKNDPARYDAYLARDREYRKIRKQQDPDFAIKCHLRGRLATLVRAGRCKRDKSAIELTGASVSELRRHLEKQFKRGMSWENYGDWHIDHIIPCSKFDLTDLRQQAICFNYLNLRPCWAAENIRKGNRITMPTQIPLGI
jgi:hypothetical protein